MHHRLCTRKRIKLCYYTSKHKYLIGICILIMFFINFGIHDKYSRTHFDTTCGYNKYSQTHFHATNGTRSNSSIISKIHNLNNISQNNKLKMTKFLPRFIPNQNNAKVNTTQPKKSVYKKVRSERYKDDKFQKQVKNIYRQNIRVRKSIDEKYTPSKSGENIMNHIPHKFEPILIRNIKERKQHITKKFAFVSKNKKENVMSVGQNNMIHFHSPRSRSTENHSLLYNQSEINTKEDEKTNNLDLKINSLDIFPSKQNTSLQQLHSDPCSNFSSVKRPSLYDDGSETPGDCPEGRILTVEPWTSLESQLWQYASVWAVSRLYDDKLNIFPRVPHFIFNTLRAIFDSLSIKSLASVPKECLKLNKSQRLINDEILKYNPSTQYDKTIVLEGASTRYDDIIKVGLADFKSEFKFIPSLVEYANNYLNKARKKLIKKLSDLIYVGVQVQRTVCSDMEHNELQKIVRIADKQFYLLAIKHMMLRYSDAVFIVVSDSPEWCEQNLITHSNWPRMYLEPHNQTLAQQMAVIAHCNHTIFDQGGLWAFTALLAGGDTFLYDPGEQVQVSLALKMTNIMQKWRKIKSKYSKLK